MPAKIIQAKAQEGLQSYLEQIISQTQILMLKYFGASFKIKVHCFLIPRQAKAPST
jgi:hypothetical protein